jgi:hypothetical protein
LDDCRPDPKLLNSRTLKNHKEIQIYKLRVVAVTKVWKESVYRKDGPSAKKISEKKGRPKPIGAPDRKLPKPRKPYLFENILDVDAKPEAREFF